MRFCILVLTLLSVTVAAHAAAPRRITLEEAFDMALSTDQSIRIAYWEVRKANLLPAGALTRMGTQISASGSLARSEQTSRRTPSSPLESGRSFSRVENGRLGVSVEQPILDLTVFPAYRYGKLAAQAARLQLQLTTRETLFGVAQAYYDVLKQQRVVSVGKESLSLAEEQEQISSVRANVGEVTRADVLRAQVAVETARRDLIEAENLLLLNRNTLSNILNLDPAEDFELVEPEGYSTKLPEFDTLLAQANLNREDLKVAAIAVDQDIARRGEVVASYGPRVVARFDGDVSNAWGDSESRDRGWDATLNVQVPIFSGGQREIDLLTADRQIRQTRLEYERAGKTVQQDVKQAWLTVRTLAQTLEALRTQVIAADQGYEDLRNQYKAGTATSVDVLSALNALNTARRDLAVQTYDYQVALRNLEQVSGVFQEERVKRSKVR